MVADDDATLAAARSGDEAAFARLVAPFQRELKAHCYRMSGSIHDAEDLLQEGLVRAWRGLPTFEGRSTLRTWLYKVTTSACLDALESKGRRILPMDLGPANGDASAEPARAFEPTWLEPCPEHLYAEAPVSPEARYRTRESVALAFLVALQLLPAKQRAVVILRDVLGWQATECASLLGSSVASVNSALQRGRETLEVSAAGAREIPAPIDDAHTSELLARYVHAWELADVGALVSLLREDATLAMPPWSAWFRGPAAIGASIGAMLFTPGARGTFRLVPTRANGLPAFAMYQRDPAGGAMRARAVHLLEVDGTSISAITAFLDASLFEVFGLPSSV
jgi:RNA polymerase sigma-70 factor (ECF subfamily)